MDHTQIGQLWVRWCDVAACIFPPPGQSPPSSSIRSDVSSPLLSLHELDEVRRDADWIGIIKQGRLVAEDTVRAAPVV
jgi:hypothetical protein